MRAKVTSYSINDLVVQFNVVKEGRNLDINSFIQHSRPHSRYDKSPHKIIALRVKVLDQDGLKGKFHLLFMEEIELNGKLDYLTDEADNVEIAINITWIEHWRTNPEEKVAFIGVLQKTDEKITLTLETLDGFKLMFDANLNKEERNLDVQLHYECMDCRKRYKNGTFIKINGFWHHNEAKLKIHLFPTSRLFNLSMETYGHRVPGKSGEYHVIFEDRREMAKFLLKHNYTENQFYVLFQTPDNATYIADGSFENDTVSVLVKVGDDEYHFSGGGKRLRYNYYEYHCVIRTPHAFIDSLSLEVKFHIGKVFHFSVVYPSEKRIELTISNSPGNVLSLTLGTSHEDLHSFSLKYHNHYNSSQQMYSWKLHGEWNNEMAWEWNSVFAGEIGNSAGESDAKAEIRLRPGWMLPTAVNKYVAFTCDYSSDEDLHVSLHEHPSEPTAVTTIRRLFQKSGKDEQYFYIHEGLAGVKCKLYDQSGALVAEAFSKLIPGDNRKE